MPEFSLVWFIVGLAVGAVFGTLLARIEIGRKRDE